MSPDLEDRFIDGINITDENDLYTALDILNQSIYEWIEENTDGKRDRLINLVIQLGISMRDTERNILNILRRYSTNILLSNQRALLEIERNHHGYLSINFLHCI